MIFLTNKQTEQQVLDHFENLEIDGVGYETTTPKVVWHWYTPVSHIGEPGTIVLSKNNQLYYCYYENYDDGDWTGYIKEGVIVAPASHFTDDKARMIPLSGVTDTAGTAGSYTKMQWGPNGETPLPNYNRCVTWNNDASNPVYSDKSTAFIPTNNYRPEVFSGAVYAYDSTIRYYGSAGNDSLSLSPYLEDGSLDPHIRSGITGYLNQLADVSGSDNTASLCALGHDYEAATACYNFTNGNNGGMFASQGTWYLPACGELVYILPRFQQINSALSAAGGILLSNNDNFWASTEPSSSTARGISTTNGSIYNGAKANNVTVIPFAKV